MSSKKKKMTKKEREKEAEKRSQIISNIILWGILVFILVFSFYRSNMSFRTRTYTVKSPSLPNAFNDFVIAQISDLDGHIYGENNSELKKALDERKPDIVVITGNLLSSEEKNSQQLAESFKEIAKAYPTYYIRGNAELSRDKNNENQQEFYQSLKDQGVIFIENSTVPILRQGAAINLTGLVPDLSYYHADPKSTDLPVDQFVKKEEGDHYQILLAHQPLYWEDYKKWGADLTISGYLHGGGLRWLFVGGVFSPEGRFFPKYDRGLYEDQQKSLVVSAGMGNSETYFRLFNPQELIFIKLESQSIH